MNECFEVGEFSCLPGTISPPSRAPELVLVPALDRKDHDENNESALPPLPNVNSKINKRHSFNDYFILCTFITFWPETRQPMRNGHIRVFLTPVYADLL